MNFARFHYRVLGNIAAFMGLRARTSVLERARKKQSDANEIKKWGKELTRACEILSVSRAWFVNLGD
jgi:hypothetical protein